MKVRTSEEREYKSVRVVTQKGFVFEVKETVDNSGLIISVVNLSQSQLDVSVGYKAATIKIK